MRSLTPEAREERRRQVIQLRKLGWTYEAIAEQTGLSRTGVFDIVQRHARHGAPGLRDKPCGRKEGGGGALSPEQEAALLKLICDKTPDQLKMPPALWNRQAVRELIGGRYGVKLTLQGVGKYLARWGFTPQRPVRRAYEQEPQAVKAWMDEAYPQIAQRAKAEGAEIQWGDETGLRSDDVRGRSYAPVGQTPEIRVMTRRDGLSVVSTVTNRGKVRRKVFLILDNLKVHRAKPVKRWFAQNTRLIEVFYLPSYSPELNPDEMLNADLKSAVTCQAPARIKGYLKKAAVSLLRRLQKLPDRVKSYFKHRPVRYAA